MPFANWSQVVGPAIAEAAKGWNDARDAEPKKRLERQQVQAEEALLPLQTAQAGRALARDIQRGKSIKHVQHDTHGNWVVFYDDNSHEVVSIPQSPSQVKETDLRLKLRLIEEGDAPEATDEQKEIGRLLKNDLQVKARNADTLERYRQVMGDARTKDVDIHGALARSKMALDTERLDQIRASTSLLRQRIEYLKSQAQGLRDRAAHFRAADANLAKHYDTEAHKLEAQIEQWQERLDLEYAKLDKDYFGIETRRDLEVRKGDQRDRTADQKDRAGDQKDRALEQNDRKLGQGDRGLDIRQNAITSRETIALAREKASLEKHIERLATQARLQQEKLKAAREALDVKGAQRLESDLRALEKQREKLQAQVQELAIKHANSVKRDELKFAAQDTQNWKKLTGQKDLIKLRGETQEKLEEQKQQGRTGLEEQRQEGRETLLDKRLQSQETIHLNDQVAKSAQLQARLESAERIAQARIDEARQTRVEKAIQHAEHEKNLLDKAREQLQARHEDLLERLEAAHEKDLLAYERHMEDLGSREKVVAQRLADAQKSRDDKKELQALRDSNALAKEREHWSVQKAMLQERLKAARELKAQSGTKSRTTIQRGTLGQTTTTQYGGADEEAYVQGLADGLTTLTSMKQKEAQRMVSSKPPGPQRDAWAQAYKSLFGEEFKPVPGVKPTSERSQARSQESGPLDTKALEMFGHPYAGLSEVEKVQVEEAVGQGTLPPLQPTAPAAPFPPNPLTNPLPGSGPLVFQPLRQAVRRKPADPPPGSYELRALQGYRAQLQGVDKATALEAYQAIKASGNHISVRAYVRAFRERFGEEPQ